jgi:hypothetical protein
MYHPALHLELANELARERARQASAASTAAPGRSRILRLLAARRQRSRRSQVARWA